MAPLRAIPGLVMDLMGELPVSDLGRIADEPTEPMPALEHAMLLGRIDQGLVDRLTAAVGPDAASPLAVVQIRHLGAGFTATPPGQGAHGPIREPFLLWALGMPATPDLADVITQAFGTLDHACRDHASGRTLLNFLGPSPDTSRWWTADTRARLSRVKVASDPHDLIRSNRPVRFDPQAP